MPVSHVRNTTVYEATPTFEPDSYEIINGWIQAIAPEEPPIDLTPMIEVKAWCIRRPTGEVSFVHPTLYVTEFEDVDPPLQPVSEEELLETFRMELGTEE